MGKRNAERNAKRVETVQATCRALEEAGLTYNVEPTGAGHYKIRAPGLPPIICSSTPGRYSAAKAYTLAKKIIQNPPPRRDIT